MALCTRPRGSEPTLCKETHSPLLAGCLAWEATVRSLTGSAEALLGLPASKQSGPSAEAPGAEQAQETRCKWHTFILMDALSSLGSRLPELKPQLTSIMRKGFSSQSKVHTALQGVAPPAQSLDDSKAA